jgi:hypothetical protein
VKVGGVVPPPVLYRGARRHVARDTIENGADLRPIDPQHHVPGRVLVRRRKVDCDRLKRGHDQRLARLDGKPFFALYVYPCRAVDQPVVRQVRGPEGHAAGRLLNRIEGKPCVVSAHA